MLAALRGLTTRGHGFLTAGAVLIAFGFAAGETNMVRVGLFVLVLPLVALLLVTRTRYRLTCDRRLEPPRVDAGDVSVVRLRVHNVSRAASGVLLAEDTLPYLLGGRPRFVLDRIEADGVREAAYRIRSEQRGRFRVGPVTVRIADPFGLCELTRAFRSTDLLTVLPKVWPLPPVRLRGEWAGAGETTLRSVATSGVDDVGTRAYRYGDDLRRVHWRSTARYGELMVRREERPWQSRAALVLDNRAVAHRGEGPGASLEWAVSAAASIGLHLAGTGYTARLITTSGGRVESSGPDRLFTDALMDHLTVVRTDPAATVRRAFDQIGRDAGEGLLVAVLGPLAPNDLDLVVRARPGQRQAVAVLMDTATWAPTSAKSGAGPDRTVLANDTAAATLRAAGWRVLEVRHGDRLADLWPQAEYRRPGPEPVPPASPALAPVRP